MTVTPRERGIYRVQTRNLLIGAYNPDFSPITKGEHTMYVFVGLREKWGRRFLTEEPGLAIEEIGMLKEKRIIVREHYPSKVCLYCGDSEEIHQRTLCDPPLLVLRENLALRNELELLSINKDEGANP